MSSEGRAYGWDEAPIPNPNEGGGFILLPPGKYPFRVKDFERGQFAGSTKTPPCKKAIIHMEVRSPDGQIVDIKDDLILHSNFEWKLCQFFTAIGDRKSGQPLAMNWMAIKGKTGEVQLKHREVTEGTHKGKVFNEVDRYLEPHLAPAMPPPASAPAATDQQGFNWGTGQQQALPATGW
jgi:hypothetical protein